MARQKKEISDAYVSPFPVALRTLMREKSVTQEKIAEVTEKTRQTVSQYVNGISEPGYETLIKIADYFDVSIDYLLGRSKDKRRSPSIYDSIGLSEESITLLRLSQEGMQGVKTNEKLSAFLPNHQFYRDFFDSEEPYKDSGRQKIEEIATNSGIRKLRLYLPEFIDKMIELAVSNPIIIENFSQIVNCENHFGGIDDIISSDEFVRFRIYEITKYINDYLLEWFSTYREIEPKSRRRYNGND